MEFRVSLATAVAAALLAVAVAAPAAIAAPPSCLAKNLRTHAEYSGDDAVASAISAAAAGNTIMVSGTCVAHVTVNRDITLQGKGKQPTLDGAGQGRVIDVADGSITLRHLTVSGGSTPDGSGAGIRVTAGNAATLIGVDVQDNTAGENAFGGGIQAGPNARLRLVGSEVEHNSAGSSGGIDSDGATVSLHGSKVSDNHATHTPSLEGDGCAFDGMVWACAGAVWNFAGTLSLVDSSVTDNTAGYRGGGLRTDATVSATTGAVTAGLTILGGSTTISSNHAGNQGGGIWTRARQAGVPVDPSIAFEASDGTITDPLTGEPIPAWTGSVTNNTPDQCFGLGFPTFSLGTHTCGATFN